MILFERTLNGPDELAAFATELKTHFQPKTVLLLEGEVGSGKTETVKALARLSGWKEVSSPSFAIHQQYHAIDGTSADHLDLYRLESEDDLESTGFWDLFSEPRGLIIIEWADRLNSDYLPPDWFKLRVRYRKEPGTRRTLTVEKIES